MALICLGSITAAPGATTLSVLLAASWPRPAVLVEADPSGGVLAVRYRLGRTPGLSGLAAVVRQGAPPEALWAYAQVLPGDQPVVVAPESGPVTNAILADAAPELASWCRSLDGVDVIVDCGRLAVRDVTWPLWAAADDLLLVSRPRADELYPVAHRYKALDRHMPSLGLVLVGDRPYKADEVAAQLGLPVRGTVAEDARAAGVLARGGSGRTLRRSPLVRSVRALAEDLAVRHGVPAMPEEAALPPADAWADGQPGEPAGELSAGKRRRRRPGRTADRGRPAPSMGSVGDREATAGARLPAGAPPGGPAPGHERSRDERPRNERPRREPAGPGPAGGEQSRREPVDSERSRRERPPDERPRHERGEPARSPRPAGPPAPGSPAPGARIPAGPPPPGPPPGPPPPPGPTGPGRGPADPPPRDLTPDPGLPDVAEGGAVPMGPADPHGPFRPPAAPSAATSASTSGRNRTTPDAVSADPPAPAGTAPVAPPPDAAVEDDGLPPGYEETVAAVVDGAIVLPPGGPDPGGPGDPGDSDGPGAPPDGGDDLDAFVASAEQLSARAEEATRNGDIPPPPPPLPPPPSPVPFPPVDSGELGPPPGSGPDWSVLDPPPPPMEDHLPDVGTGGPSPDGDAGPSRGGPVSGHDLDAFVASAQQLSARADAVSRAEEHIPVEEAGGAHRPAEGTGQWTPIRREALLVPVEDPSDHDPVAPEPPRGPESGAREVMVPGEDVSLDLLERARSMLDDGTGNVMAEPDGRVGPGRDGERPVLPRREPGAALEAEFAAAVADKMPGEAAAGTRGISSGDADRDEELVSVGRPGGHGYREHRDHYGLAPRPAPADATPPRGHDRVGPGPMEAETEWKDSDGG